MKKPDKRRKDVAALLKIAQGLDWGEVKLKITEKLAECLKLKKPDLSDYELTFSVPWHQTSPIPLVNEDDFENLCEAAIKCKDPQAKEHRKLGSEYWVGRVYKYQGLSAE